MRIKPNADGHFCSWNSAFLYRWPVGQAVKTAASHAANGSSILPRVTTSEWTTFHSKSPAIRLGFSHTISSFLLFPTKLCKANFCGGPAAGGKRTPRQNGLHSIKNSDNWLGFFHTISSFLLFPIKLCKANFCGGPAAGKKMSCFSYYSTISTSHKLRKKQRLVFI